MALNEGAQHGVARGKLTEAKAAELLGLNPKRVYELSRTPSFPAFRCGARVVISAEGLRDWVKQQAAGGAAV